jgi:hypothetical protein
VGSDVRVWRAAALAALATGCAAMSEPLATPGEVVRVDLDSVAQRRAELDGRWVEFDAFVYRGTPERRFLVAVPGRKQADPQGAARTMCRGTPETNLPVVLKGGLGPLPRDSLRTADRQRRVTIRAIFRAAPFTDADHWTTQEWPAYVDQAKIVAVHDEWCDLYPLDSS